MKSILLLVGLFLVMLGSVSAGTVESGTRMRMYNGWNLVPIFNIDGGAIQATSEIQMDDVAAIFFYLNFRQKMYQFYPRNTIDSENGTNEENRYILNSAFWVYSNKKGILEVKRDEFKLPLSETKLQKGWNFIGITDEMVNRKLSETLSKCSIEKIYFWDAKSQKWKKIGFDDAPYNDLLGTGIIVKVKDNCNMNGALPYEAPPPLPDAEVAPPEEEVPSKVCNEHCLTYYDTDGICGGKSGVPEGSIYCNNRVQCMCLPQPCSTDLDCKKYNVDYVCNEEGCMPTDCDTACKRNGYSEGACGGASGKPIGTLHCAPTLKQCMCV